MLLIKNKCLWRSFSYFLSIIVFVLLKIEIISSVLFVEIALISEYMIFLIVELINSVVWLVLTFSIPIEDKEVLLSFYKKLHLMDQVGKL